MKLIVALILLLVGALEEQNFLQQSGLYKYAIYSNQDIILDESSKNAVLCFKPLAWDAYIPGAKWIWSTASSLNLKTKEVHSFSKKFLIPGFVSSGTLTVAADNSFKTIINKMETNCFSLASSTTKTTQVKCDVAKYLLPKDNEIKITVTNSETLGSENNPAGLLFYLVISFIPVNFSK